MVKISIVILFLIILTTSSFGQDTSGIKPKSIFDDTTLIRTILVDKFIIGSRIVAFNFGKNAIIYLSEKSILDTISKGALSTYDYERKNSKSIIKILKEYKSADTVFLKGHTHYLMYLVSGQLKKGNAKVFDKKSNAFAPFIYHRLERVISAADRVYYFADKRRFFQVQEWSGIIPNELMPEIE